MFQGRWPNILNVDAKNRLTLPTVFRPGEGDELGGQLFIGRLLDDCLYLHTRAQQDQLLERLYRKLGDSKASRLNKTAIISRFVPVGVDGNGRITIPGFLREESRIKKEVILIAQKSRVEIWAAEVFKETFGERGLPDEVAVALEEVFEEEERELLEEVKRGATPD